MAKKRAKRKTVKRKKPLTKAKRLAASAPYDAASQGEKNDPPTIESYRSQITSCIATGFMSRNEIIELISAMANDGCPSKKLRREIEQMTDEAIRLHKRVQKSWPKVTDCDRLDAAFAELEQEGIVCRQNFSCCGTCGVGEMEFEMEEQRDTGREVVGYTFYHPQDTEAAVEGCGLCLNYGSIKDKQKPALAVARQVVQTLNRHGLKTDWDGKFENRIFVKVDWKRRTNSKTDQLPAVEPT